MPYTEMPEDVTVGVASHYASVLTRRGEALGVVVQSYEGRPTKVEGNPDHPASAGATDLHAQATLFDLYDTERARSPTLKGAPKAGVELDAALAELAGQLAASGGAGLRILSEPTLSPTFLRLRAALKAKLPNAVFHTYAPVSDSNERAGTRARVRPPSRGAQPLGRGPGDRRARLRLPDDRDRQRGSDTRLRDRAPHGVGVGDEPNRLYVVEPTHERDRLERRSPAEPARAVDRCVRQGARGRARRSRRLARRSSAVPARRRAELAGVAKPWIKAVAKDLAEHRARRW